MSDAEANDNFDDQDTVLPGAAKAGATQSAFPEIVVPTIDNYEILSELGRGGMGVVYKARDTKLDRIVALKMILGGKFASNEEIQRFRLEGESAARLDHPGIVPIYEIEQVKGNHFFSMKFVEGNSLLDKLDDYKSDRRAACDLIAKIADAVQHAHQRAVLHRDLKPANVLIDQEGQPAITDFGLAKRMDGESELTQTGLVMGTPGFMSPEQAAGRKDITTATDVFSLGAMLYWIVTGEPPFKGETGIQAVMSTIEGDVPSLRHLIPSANTDLDLICQKAMHKDPLQRYSSAAAFAEDLRAWLDGEPLSVRNATAMSVASIWVRKNLRVVLAACLTGVLCGLIVGGIIAISEMRNAAQREHWVQELGGVSSKTWVNSFLSLRHMSDNWKFVQFLIVPAIAVCAFMCILFTKPKTREANFVSAVTCGFAASAVAFLLTGGWGIMSTYSVDTGSKDIELLSTALWLDSDVERKLAQRAMMQRYPGLEEMETAKRQQIIRQKILHGQTSGLTPGLWMGVCIAILFTGLPLMITCILSGSMWRQGIRGWEWFGCTWERAAYLLVFFLILSFWLRPLTPSTWLMLMSLSALLFALFLAVRMSHWFWRVVMIPVPFICMMLINGDVISMNNSNWLAGKTTSDAELRMQLVQSDRLHQRIERPSERFATGVGWLYLNEEEKYQSYCRELCSSFEFAYRPEIASQLAKLCMLRPDLQRAEDFELACELSEFASGFESSENARWFYSTRALVELRRGNPEDAIVWNLKCRENEQDADGYRHAISHAVDSLAWLKLGDNLKARKSLEMGRTCNEDFRGKAMEDGIDHNWPDYLFFQIVEKEILAELN